MLLRLLLNQAWAQKQAVTFLVVPRRNEVAEGGYWITLRQSVRPSIRPSIHLFALNNFKSFGRNLMISDSGLIHGGFHRLYQRPNLLRAGIYYKEHP